MAFTQSRSALVTPGLLFASQPNTHDSHREHSYKYYINRKWKLKKSIPSSKKDAMLNYHQSRAAVGKSTHFQFAGRDVDPKKLRRHLKDERRKQIVLKDTANAVSGSAPRLARLFSPLTTNM